MKPISFSPKLVALNSSAQCNWTCAPYKPLLFSYHFPAFKATCTTLFLISSKWGSLLFCIATKPFASESNQLQLLLQRCQQETVNLKVSNYYLTSKE